MTIIGLIRVGEDLRRQLDAEFAEWSGRKKRGKSKPNDKVSKKSLGVNGND